MFQDLIEFPLEHPRLSWKGRLVVRDLLQKPNLFLRLTLTGTHFPLRALEPWVRVGTVISRFALISDDCTRVNAYFNHPPPALGVVEFGYGQKPLLRFGQPFDTVHIPRLERKLLPPDIHVPVGLLLE